MDIKELWVELISARNAHEARKEKNPELSGTREQERWLDAESAIRRAGFGKLHNGATVMSVAYRKGRTDERVVLAFTSRLDVHPWVTWAIDEQGSAFWGHYFNDPAEALADFHERIA